MTPVIYPAVWGEYFLTRAIGNSSNHYYLVIRRGSVVKEDRFIRINDSGSVIHLLFLLHPRADHFSLSGSVANAYWRALAKDKTNSFIKDWILKIDRRWQLPGRARVNVKDQEDDLLHRFSRLATYLRSENIQVLWKTSVYDKEKTFRGKLAYKVKLGDYLIQDSFRDKAEHNLLTRLVDIYYDRDRANLAD